MNVARQRGAAMFVARTSGNPQPSYEDIGAAFGNRDHTTVIHAIERVIDRLEMESQDTVDFVDAIEAALDER